MEQNILAQIGGYCFYLFGKFFGTIIYIIVMILIIYFLDKKILRPMWKDRGKRFSISYNIDKYILRRKNLNVEFD